MHVLITGAAGGLGRAFAVSCARKGYHLFLTDVNEAGLRAIQTGLRRQYGVSVEIKACNLTEKEELKALFEHIDNLQWRFDMLLNVAGIDFEGGFMTLDTQKVSRIVRLNVEATLCVTYETIARRRQGEKFSIVFVSSLASLYPMPLKATYAASKRFLLDFSIALSHELRSQRVSVMALCPGGLATTQEALSGMAAQGFWGRVTSNSLETVTERALRKALRGRPVYIPGVVNRIFSICASLIPKGVIARVLLGRWQRAQKQWLVAS